MSEAQRVIEEKFLQWKDKLTGRDACIAVYSQIRDIPYRLVPQINEPLEWAAAMLRDNLGSCSPKHYLLGYLFERLGIAVRYVTFCFRWQEQEISYPPQLKELSQGIPAVYHIACKAHIEGEWVLVDATFDRGLAGLGFPVNRDWDGRSNTLNAVSRYEEIVHHCLKERLEFVEAKKLAWSEEDRRRYLAFSERFNLWLEEFRARGKAVF